MNLEDLHVDNLIDKDSTLDELKLGELVGFTDSFQESTPSELVHQHLTQNAKLPAVLVLNDNELCGVISRPIFFQLLSRTNGLAVYHPRPISLMLQHANVEMLRLSSTCSVREAVNRCLQRPPAHLYEPVVVADDDAYKIIDFHTLIIAQSQLLQKTTLYSERQQLLLKQKNLEILDSIHYAQRIQKSMLRDPERLNKWGLDLFLIFKPRDIVSGDFFYVTEFQGKIFVAVVDCTGHGVPGAFMSMIGHNLLDDVVTSKGVTDPSQILSCLNDGIRRSLNQEHDSSSRRDGMDACLCVIQPGEQKMSFCGAKRPLYFTTSKGETIVCNGDHYSIGGVQHEQSRTFTTQHIDMEAGQTFFLTTDGYTDQHSDDNKKFGTARLKALIREIHALPLDEKKHRLESALVKHQSQQSQRDDITIIGLEWLGMQK